MEKKLKVHQSRSSWVLSGYSTVSWERDYLQSQQMNRHSSNYCVVKITLLFYSSNYLVRSEQWYDLKSSPLVI